MLKNKIVAKKIRNIVILFMTIIIMLGAYSNIRRSKAENVIPISMEVADKTGALSVQTLDVEAKESTDGIYILDLPTSVKGNFVTKYYTVEGEEIPIDINGETITLQLTEEELTNKKVQLQTDYDKKDVTLEDKTITLYNKQIKYGQVDEKTGKVKELDEVIVKGYMPLEAKLEFSEIDLATLTAVKLPNEKETMKKAYELSVFEEVEVVETVEAVNNGGTTTEGEATPEGNMPEENTTEGTTPTQPEGETIPEETTPTEPTTEEVITKEKVEYNPGIYGEELQVNIKHLKNEDDEEIVTVYNLAENNAVTKTESTLENEYIKFKSRNTLTKYIVAVEKFEKGTVEDGVIDGPGSTDAPEVSATTGTAKPSDLFDADGTNADGLHIGDFVNYDAGTWTQEEINAIQVGPKDSLVTANGSTDLPSTAFQFGGFAAGSSRNENATLSTLSGSGYNYIKDAATGEAITGWRVFDIDGDKVTLISAGSPEDYYHGYETNSAYASEYILTGNVNSAWNESKASNYQKRSWNNYVNATQKAESATVLTKSRLDSWYSKYIVADADTNNENTFQNIYNEYKKYQSVVDNYTFYWLSAAGYGDFDVYNFNPDLRVIGSWDDSALGVRVLVTLSSDSLFSSEKAGTKTVTGGNTTTYGGNQTYNVWNLYEPIPTWQASSINIDQASQTATIEITGTDANYASNTLTAGNITVHVNGTATTSGITKTLSAATPIENGVKYTVTVSGIALDKKQVKIQIAAGTLTDEAGNTNEKTDIMIYNTLKAADKSDIGDSAFLGNTNVPRRLIENVTFVSSTADANPDTKWDVSAQGDGSIMAWYNETAEPYTIYIGSEQPIFANQDSSYLFAYIGFTKLATKTSAVTNINLLNTSLATNMSNMFYFTGYRTMTSFDLSSLDTRNVTNMREMFNGCGYNEMTSLTLGSNFNTSKVTDMSWMFSSTGYKKMTSLTLPDAFNTASVIDMSFMFMGTGYTKMTALNLGNNFNTESVTEMTGMFQKCGYEEMTSLNLGSNFNTSSVTNMSRMFESCGYQKMATLNLGSNFNTSSVTDMGYMFANCGYVLLPSIDLGANFDTTNVTNMRNMFNNFAHTKLTTLNLGQKFNTAKVTDMTQMFMNCGNTAMTKLYLGPAFTKIAATNTDFVTNCGKSGTVIYAPESIYSNRNAFKLSSTDTTTTIPYTQGTINAAYRPEWSVTSSTLDTTNKTISINITGTTNSTYYTSTLTSALKAENITIYIDGEEASSVTKALTEATTGTSVTHTLTLSNFEEALRQTGKTYKEWSGNIALKIEGRGEGTDTYTKNTLVDSYGNQSMAAIDSTGTWVEINLKDSTTSTANTNGKMFTDFIKPEITYKYSKTDLDKENGTAKIIFAMADKYYASTNTDLTVNDLTILINGEVPDWTKVTRKLTVGNVTATINGTSKVIGREYTLQLSNLYQDEKEASDNYLKYSGVITVAIPAGKVADTSGNKNDAKTITMGMDMPETDFTTPYLPTGFVYIEGSLDEGLVIEDALGNQFVWVEVPKTAKVYPTAGLNITEFTSTELTSIEKDLQTYTTTYRGTYVDSYNSNLSTGLTSAQYSALKNTMLKSVYKNGGFYIGRYETGIDYSEGPSAGSAAETPVIKANAYPYYKVKVNQAQTLASSFAADIEGYVSNMLFGLQWDLMLKYLETKGVTQDELMADSTEWGNYNVSRYDITNTNAKYYISAWNDITEDAPYNKTAAGDTILTTGASETFKKQNIYDIAGNVWEYSLEYGKNSSDPAVVRGGCYTSTTDDKIIAGSRVRTTNAANDSRGFRVALYRDDPYLFHIVNIQIFLLFFLRLLVILLNY